jgi:cysteine synthase B
MPNQLSSFVGNTPLVKLNYHNPKVSIFAKLEGNNPGGSVKDRAALHMLKTALAKGEIREGDHLIEATSGNTGIALALFAQVLKLKITLVMPENSTIERIITMKAYGATLILTPAEKTIEFSRIHAEELAIKHGYKMLNQFSNHANAEAHYLGTGPEIWRDTNGQITHFISAMGTTGTITGVSRYLKEQNKAIQTIGAQPADGENIPGIRKWSEAMRPAIFQADLVDQLVDVSKANAIASARELALQEGILAGMSSGGAYYIAKHIADKLSEGTIVFIACDRGDRYLSSELYN